MLDEKIQRLLDLEEIRNLRTMYSQHLDTGNIDGLDAVFSPHAIVEVTVGTMRGIDEIKKGLEGAFALFDRDKKGRFPFLHAVTNHQIEMIGPDLAEGRSYLIDLETASKADPNPLLLLGVYADEYRRVDGRWMISRSRLEVVWPETNGGAGHPGKGLQLPSDNSA